MQDYWLYIGNTSDTDKSIFVSRFHTATGELTPARPAAPAEHPNFLALHPTLPVLYAVTAAKLSDYEGAIEAFAINPATGDLLPINRQPSGGQNPAHLAVHPTGNFVVVANYDGATIAAFPLDSTGQLAPHTTLHLFHGFSINPQRQTKPYPHGVTFNSDGAELYVADLGTDQIVVYHVQPNAPFLTLAHADGATIAMGSGPRHLALSSNNQFAYLINELTSTITVLAFKSGGLREIQTLRPWDPRDSKPNTGAEIQIHPNQRFLYASNRGHDSLAICEINRTSGKLTLVALQPTLGQVPRHFAIDPTGQFLIAENLRSNSLIVFRIDPATGKLTPTDHQITAPSPLCVTFVPIP